MFVLLGLIGMALAVGFDYLLMSRLNIALSNLNIFFIIPIGGIILGILSSFLMFKYLKLRNIRPTRNHYLYSAFISFAAFVSIIYVTYASTYIDNGEVNYLFKGQHISNYMYNDTEAFNFQNYIDFKLEHAKTKFSYKSRQIGNDVSLGKGINILSNIINLLGFMIGGALFGAASLGTSPYCHGCKKYMKKEDLYKFTYSSLSEEVNGLAAALSNSVNSLEDFIYGERPKFKKKETYFEVRMMYCPSCYDGYLELKCMQARKDSLGRISWRENTRAAKKFKLTPEMVERLL